MPHPLRARRLGRRLAGTATASLLVAALVSPAGPAQAANPPTPGSFTGYGFDQCLAPTQQAMNAWLRSSPFWAVGIYISGDSRACRSQPNLTPAWVTTQLRNGWRLMPITLGPQASCNPRFPRYSDDVKINPRPHRNYRAARLQGRREATKAVEAAQALGIRPGSTLWYDMEAYDIGNTDCRESALRFTAGWTTRLHALDYVSGVYSSAASGIKALDDARVNRPGAFALPDRIWIADWDGKANTSSTYIRDAGWRPGGRMKQYRGGHNETHGGVTINIDSNFLDLGAGSVAGKAPEHCGGVRVSYARYPFLSRGETGDHARAAQCLLKEQGYYDGPVNGSMDVPTQEAVRALRTERGMSPGRTVGPRVWTALHAPDSGRIIKYGAAGERVRRLQRALNAASSEKLAVSGTFEATTTAAVKRYQARQKMPQTGVVTRPLWRKLRAGRI